MKNHFCSIRLAVLIPFVILFVLVGCDKDDTPSAKDQKAQAWAKEVFQAMKFIYLWNDALPNDLNAKQYNSPEKALEHLAGLKINSQTGQPIDRYSFLDKIGNLSGEIQEGIANDYGFMVIAAYNSSKQVSFFVNYVYKNSPAGVAGIDRSCEIIKINGSSDVHPGVTTSGYLDDKSAGYKNMVNALFNSTSATFTFKKMDGTVRETSLNIAKYSLNSVLCDTIYTIGTKKVGYLVFNEFLGDPSQIEISKSISKFQNNDVKEVIVDLRYNGGGSVQTCEMFSNMLAPQSANGKVMYSYKFNPELTHEYKNENLTVNFNKTNLFSPAKLYFIVSYHTASASELLINNLQPYYSDRLFLIGDITYGKPCGFWPTPIGYDPDDKNPKEGYDLYAVSMETVNANNEGGYYSGMEPGSSKYPGIKDYDSLLPWGDTNDKCLAQALNHIAYNSFKVSQKSSASKARMMKVQSFTAIDRHFKGMIDFRKHVRP